MKAAGLKAIDTVVSSTAVLIKSKNPTNPNLVDLIASRILGVISTSACFSVSPLTLTWCSRSEVCPLPIQH
jgi:ATP phosphoribosyltransferase